MCASMTPVRSVVNSTMPTLAMAVLIDDVTVNVQVTVGPVPAEPPAGEPALPDEPALPAVPAPLAPPFGEAPLVPADPPVGPVPLEPPMVGAVPPVPVAPVPPPLDSGAFAFSPQAQAKAM